MIFVGAILDLPRRSYTCSGPRRRAFGGNTSRGSCSGLQLVHRTGATAPTGRKPSRKNNGRA